MSTGWRACASIETLRYRAELMRRIRHFLNDRGVLEVDTPVLAAAPASDPHLHSFSVSAAGRSDPRWLLTSPESGLKRLLASGSGDVYQLAHVFRADETGRWHSLEFCMLEWYRCGWSMAELMEELREFLIAVSGRNLVLEQQSYAELFVLHTRIDPLDCTLDDLRDHAQLQEYAPTVESPEWSDRDFWLDLILSMQIMPALADLEAPLLVTGFPASQASLTRVNPDNEKLADRFELYWRGVELANGGQEETRPDAVRARIASDQRSRAHLGLAPVPKDENLLAALDSGLPECAGVALGVDRLLALILDLDGIEAAMPLSAG